MAASLASKWFRVGRSLLGGLGNNLSGLLSTSNEMASSNSNLLSYQQQRTFIQMGSVLKVVDNSGAKTVTCIHPEKGKKVARLGDTIIASVKELNANKREIVKGAGATGKKGQNTKTYKVKKGEVVKAVIVRTAMPWSRRDGSVHKFDDNAVALVERKGGILVTKKQFQGRFIGNPIGKRVFGPVPFELRKKWQLAVLSLAEDTT